VKTLLCVLAGSCLFAASAFGATHATPAAKCVNQYQPNQTNAEADACAAAASAGAMVKPPAIPIANAKAVAKAAFTGDYNTIWNYISPQYQTSISHSHWLSCQKRNPVAPPNVKVDRIAIASSGNVPVALPKFGSQKVFEVQMQVLFTRGGAQSAALVYAYWFHNNQNKWVAVWLPTVYSTYASGGCDPVGPARGLY
jgi:hypothetical protein